MINDKEYDKVKTTRYTIINGKLQRVSTDYKHAKSKAIKISLGYKRSNPRLCIWNRTKQRALKEGILFTISPEDIVIPKKCPYLNVPLTNKIGNGRMQSSMSIDRIDPTKGYIPGNIQIISDLANRMKQDATIDQLITFSLNVIRLHHKSKPK